MSQKDYRMFAAMIKARLDKLDRMIEESGSPRLLKAHRSEVKVMALSMAVIFKDDNLNFRRDIFLKACGLKP